MLLHKLQAARMYFGQVDGCIASKQLAECHIPYTVPSANIFTIQRVYGCKLHKKAPDGASSTIGSQAETERSGVSACILNMADWRATIH